MIQRRLGETDEEYEKRKRRVKLVMMGGLASGGSQVLATILYQTNLGNFIYATDESGNAILDNRGSGGPTYDGLLNTGRALELGATNDLVLGDAAKWITWYDFADSQFHKQFGVKTFNSITVNNILVSASEPSDLDIARLNNNPQLMAKLADPSGSGTISELDMVLTASDAWYPCSENEGAYVVDARAGYGANSITNGELTTDVSGFTPAAGTFTWSAAEGGSGTLVGSLATSNPYINGTTGDISAGTLYKATVRAKATQSDILLSTFDTATRYFNDANFISTSWTEYSIIVSGDYTRAYLLANKVSTDVPLQIDIDYIRYEAASAQEITNYVETIRSNADFNPNGLQTTCLVLDGAGIPTAYDASALHFYSNGYVDTQWNPTVKTPWTLTETINTVENVVLDTDNVNENANYLLGKGAYPKVTADPYATYQQQSFQVEDK